MNRKDLLNYLTEYAQSDYVPMHMPGAKRNGGLFNMGNPYELDITEIDGFDNMHNAQGIIKNAFARCAKLFGADESLFLVNGSSAGILAAICGATKKGDKVLVARHSHVSVYNALYMNELAPIYIYSEIDECGYAKAVTPQQIEALFKENVDGDSRITAVIITSPTYEGLVADVRSIADIAHKYDAVLIVDEAHGAHLNFSDEFPKSAVSCGADAVVQSVHKTLPAFTQTALLHMNGSRIDRERVTMYWNIYQTTSPSYILMAGIDRCVSILEERGDELFGAYVRRLVELRRKLAALKNICLQSVDDISKIVLATGDGKTLYDKLLNEYHIQLEMASLHYVIAMTSIGDTDEYYERFYEALKAIDEEMDCHMAESEFCKNEQVGGRAYIQSVDDTYIKSEIYSDTHHQQYSIYEAVNSPKEYVKLAEAAGRVSGAKICFYPPGVPLVVEGEIITENDVRRIKGGLKSGLEVLGVKLNIAVGSSEDGLFRQEESLPAPINKYEEEVEVLCLR